MSAPEQRRLAPVVALRLVRVGMVLGTLAFGGVVWLLYRKASLHPEFDPGRVRLYRNLALGMWIAGSAALGTTLLLRQRARDDARDGVYAIVGWAVGEAVAVSGGVFYLLSGRTRFYVLGLVFFAVALLLTPLRRE